MGEATAPPWRSGRARRRSLKMNLLPKLQGVSPQLGFAALGYMICSSCMLVVNKLTVHYIPAPLMVVFAQLAMTTICVRAAGALGLIQVDPLTWAKVSSFVPASVIFILTIGLNMMTLQYANVETFIVFRASTPLALSLCEYCFMQREMPSVKSWIALLTLTLGAALYVYTDAGFHIKGYAFVMVWYVVFCADQLYLRRIVDVVPMSTNWGRVYYSNFIGCLPLPLLGIMSGEHPPREWTSVAVGIFVVSLVLSTAISYFAWQTRALVSAAAFSVLGNVCKVLTITINCLVWDKHATPFGVFCLALCLSASLMYEQAPLRVVQAGASASGENVMPSEDALIAAQDSVVDELTREVESEMKLV